MSQPTISVALDPNAPSDTTRSLITERIRGEFREMPGLTLTTAQAQRLWHIDVDMCTEILSQLVDAGFLCRKANGAYCRPSDLSFRPLQMAKASLQFAEVHRRHMA